jgi:hypothetical protein
VNRELGFKFLKGGELFKHAKYYHPREYKENIIEHTLPSNNGRTINFSLDELQDLLVNSFMKKGIPFIDIRLAIKEAKRSENQKRKFKRYGVIPYAVKRLLTKYHFKVEEYRIPLPPEKIKPQKKERKNNLMMQTLVSEKTAEVGERKPPTTPEKTETEITTTIKEKSISRKNIRTFLNKMGKETIFACKDIIPQESDRNYIARYLSQLCKNGFLERISHGQYKILKKITIRKRGKSKPKPRTIKDLNMILTILKSSKKGYIVDQIEEVYKRLTPPEQQIEKSYLDKLLTFGLKKGILKHDKKAPELRKGKRGPIPKRIVLENPNVTDDEWNQFIDTFRKLKRDKREKTSILKSKKIIESFDEHRDNKNKQFVENFFIDRIQENLGGQLIKCFTITGPDYHRHINKLFEKIAEKVIVCEINPHVFNVIYRKALTCPYYLDNRVSLLNCDLDDIDSFNCSYVDLDLMITISNIYNSVLRQIKNQEYSCNETNLKSISFTASIRCDGGEIKRLELLKDLLYEAFELELEGFLGGTGFGKGYEVNGKSEKLNFCHKHIPIINKYGSAKNVYVFTYQDHTPMISVLVVYK